MQEESVIFQYFAALVVGLFKLTDGMLIGWVSPNLVLLKSNETDLASGALTDDEAAWVPTLMPIGSTVGTLSYGFVANRFGRKFPLIALLIPSIIGWILSWAGRNVISLYFARLFHGFTIGASYVVAPCYLIEIADDRVRGILGASIMINENIGVLIGFVLGGFCDYYVLPLVAIILNIAFVALFVWFPETPAFLMKQNKIQETEKSIRFYRNVRTGATDVVEEIMDSLKSAASTNATNVDGNRIKLLDLTTRPGSRALLIAIVLVLINQFSGVFTLMNYAAEIFKSSGSAVSENLSSVIVQAIQSIGTCFVTVLIERAGRRFLYITSTIGTAFGYTVLGIYVLLYESNYDVETFNWIPIASFSFILFISSWAVSSLTFSVAAELLPQKLREFGITLCAVLLGIAAFAVLKLYPVLAASIGQHNCMFIFAVICVAGAVFIIFVLPEIKGKSYEEIMSILHGKQREMVQAERIFG